MRSGAASSSTTSRWAASRPAGYEPVVDVYLAGREQPLELGFVETRRDIDDPWVRLQQHNCAFDDAEAGGRHPGDIFPRHEGAILRVEVRYDVTGKRPGRFEWTEDDGAG